MQCTSENHEAKYWNFCNEKMSKAHFKIKLDT